MSTHQPTWDLLVRDVRVVRPGVEGTLAGDIAVADGKVVEVGPGLDPTADLMECRSR